MDMQPVSLSSSSQHFAVLFRHLKHGSHPFMQAPATKLSMTEKERLLPKLVEEGWLASVPGQQGTYSIGVRIADCLARATEHACLHGVP